MKKKPATAETPASPPPSVRLDIWLWAARFFRTRALAKQAIEGGKVEVGDAQGRPARMLHVGDRLRITRGEERFEIVVAELPGQRGSATTARRCYQETEESRVAREAAAEQRKFANAGYQRPASKPDKRARRLIRALGDIDSM